MKFYLFISFLLFSAACANAQVGSLPDLVNQGLKLMQEGKWQESLNVHNQTIKDFGINPSHTIKAHGAQFGTIWFRKGIAELKLGLYHEAAKSFEVCYKDYPDSENAPGSNKFHKMALLKWGDAEFAAGNNEAAVKLWMKFLEERDKQTDDYPKGLFHINLSVAYYRLGDFEKGSEYLETAIKNKASFPTQDEAIIFGFQAAVMAGISLKNEKAILDVIRKNKDELVVAPYAMQGYTGIFMKLAADALSAQMIQASLRLYQFIPDSKVALNDLEARIRSMGFLPQISVGHVFLNQAALESQVPKWQAELSSGKSNESIKLAATAYIHETGKNLYGAYACYLQLEQIYPHSENRESNLFNLLRVASMIGKTEETQKYGLLFIEEYPKSEQKSTAQKILLSSLFDGQKYHECIELTRSQLDQKLIKKNTPDHDFLLYILGASHFYLGQFEESASCLDDHIKLYPESKFAVSSEYMRASNASRLKKWKEAGEYLDAFLAKNEKSTDYHYISLALYDRGLVHHMLSEYETSIKKLDRIIKDFSNSSILDQAYLLQGNNYQSSGRENEAERAYLEGLKISETRGNMGLSGEILYLLIRLLSVQDAPIDRLQKALPFIDKFWGTYAKNSSHQAQVAVTQIPALLAAKRDKDCLMYLQNSISTLAKQTEAIGLEEAINAYTDLYLKKSSLEKLREHYYSFPGILHTDKAASALLRLAMIGVYEKSLKSEKDAKKSEEYRLMISVLFQNLKADFELDDLSNYTLARIGDYLRNYTSTPLEAIPYYDEILSRADESYQMNARIGRADLVANADQISGLVEALKDFEIVFQAAEDQSLREYALFRMSEVLMKQGEFKQAAFRANQYLERDEKKSFGFRKYIPEVGLILAQSFENQKLVDDALSMYVKVWSANMGYIKISAPAVESWMKLSFERNHISSDSRVPSDRQGAYEGGYRYLELTGRHKDQFSSEELALWQKVENLTKTYESSLGVKSMQQILKEKEETSKQR